MTDKEFKEIREKISCPQLGDEHYGEWGILTKSQRFTIKRLLDGIESREAYIKKLRADNERLKSGYKNDNKSLNAYLSNLVKNQKDTIDKQEAEIERLKDLYQKCAYEREMFLTELNDAKAEAVKEFADLSIKRICEQVSAPTPSESYIVEKCNQAINNLLKEMEGK